MSRSLRLLILLPLYLFFICNLHAQRGDTPYAVPEKAVEICDNEIDDDSDGYVDCYDTDCACDTVVNCSISAVPSTFKARTAWQSTQDAASVAAAPVVANMNPQDDNMPEIIVAQAMSNNPLAPGFSNRILFFRGDGSNAGAPMALTIPGTVFYNRPIPGPTIGDIDRDGKPELLISCNDRRIRVYRDYTENPAAPMTLWITSTDLLDFQAQRPFLADFDGDGTPEVYAGNDIFRFDLTNPAAPTLTKVNNLLPNMGRVYGLYNGTGSCNSTAADLLSVADCNGDPDCGGLELAAGPVIYSVDLDPNDGDGYEIKIQRQLIPTAQANFTDGYTAVADVDLDGIMDIIVSSTRSGFTGVYIWNKNGIIQFFPYPTNTALSGALPCIANVYDDRTEGFAQDFPEILVGTTHDFSAFNLQAAQKYPATPYWWNLNTAGGSGASPVTTFDFNGDGIQEILYRGSDLRIAYGGPAPFPPGVDVKRNWFSMPTQTVVADEYPVVADVDNDGEAEIVLAAVVGNAQLTDVSRLRVLESAESPWVPCRQVWNQYNYFVVNVNDDLTIPIEQQLHHLEMPPGSGNRPLNRYLAQRQTLGGKIPVADAAAQAGAVSCLNNQFNFQLEVCNPGDKTLKAGTPVAFYKSDPQSTNAALAAPVFTITADIEPDSCLLVDVPLPGLSGSVFGVVNDDGSLPRPFNLATAFPATDVPECNYLNNIFQVDLSAQAPLLNIGPDIAVCDDTMLILRAGSGRLSYQWQDGSTDSMFLVQGPGLYWVEVEDQCVGFHSDSILVAVLGHPQVQIDTVNGDCFGKQATATATANSAYPPLAYNWSTMDTGPVISGVPDGMYSVTVTDAKGCSSVDSSWVETGGLLEVGFSTTAIPCNGQTGGIDISIAAGTPPFTFAWSNSATGSNVQNLPAGTYAVTVTDADACSKVLQITLTEPGPLTSQGFSVTGACPGEPNGSALFLGAAQGTPPYALTWPGSSTAPALPDVPAGTYTLTITDTNGCTLEDIATVPELEPPVLDTVVSSVSCYGANDGSISLQASGGSPTLGFMWSNAMTTPSIQGLGPGAYFLILAYADGRCTEFFDFKIAEPQALFSDGIIATPSCPGEANGVAALTGISQGTPPYAYLWPDGSNGTTLTGLTAGNYSVVVTDANGCSLTESVQVTEFAVPAIDSTVTPASCAGAADGSISLSISGGTPGFGYQWSNSQTTSDLQQLAAGPYSLTLTYADGQCVQYFDFLVTEPLPLVSAGISTATACPGEANGSAVFLGASQGNPPYSLLWSTSNTTSMLASIPGGLYTLTVSDAKGCTLLESVQVPEFTAPTLDSIVQNISCFGNADGRISTSLSGGTPGFSYTWSNSATTPVIQGLGPGFYSLTLTFADSVCAQTYTFEVHEPQPLLSNGINVQPACSGEANGVAIFNGITQGTPPYGYLWSNGSSGTNLTGVPAGTYSVTITDANGCSLVQSVDIPNFEAPLLDTVLLNIKCTGEMSGSIATNITGGGPADGYLWSTGDTGPAISGLGAGAYSLTVSYGNGQCALHYYFELSAPEVLKVDSAQIIPVACFEEDNGAIHIQPSGGTPPYQFLWSGGQTTPDPAQLFAGNYTLTLTDVNGCSNVNSYTVLQPEPLTAAWSVQMDTCGAQTGAIDVTFEGGTAPYSLKWSTGAPVSHLDFLPAGIYSFILTDAQGCTYSKTLSVDIVDYFVMLTPYSQTITCAQPEVSIGVLSNQPDLNYSWVGPTGTLPDQAGQLVSVSGTYFVTASNPYGCSSIVQIVVQEDTKQPLAEAGPVQIDVPCDQINTVLDASSSSTGPDYVPRWYMTNNGAIVFDTTALSISIQAPGLYIFSNTDTTNGCMASDSVFVTFANPILAGAEADSVTCAGANDGSIRLQILGGGTPPFEFSIDNQSFSANNVFNHLTPGVYPLTVRDSLGCTWTSAITLNAPEIISVSLTASDTIIALGQAVTLEAIPLPPGLPLTDIYWEPISGGLAVGALIQNLTPNETTEYLVQITDKRGCTASDRILVRVNAYQIYAPNAIAPGSSENNRFTLYTASGIRQVKLLQIYDRWGELVFENRNFLPNDPDQGWDGSFRAKTLQPGVYVWYAELESNDGSTVRKSGDVTIAQ